MPELAVWSEDICTCEHKQSQHKDTNKGPWLGRCKMCEAEWHWSASGPGCQRFQWNGEPRKRLW